MGKKLILGLILACFGLIFAVPNLVPKIFFPEFNFYLVLYIFARYHCMQFQGKPKRQTWENGQKPSFQTNFGPNFPCPLKNFFLEFCIYKMLCIVTSYHYMQFQEKLMNQTWENGKKPSFGTDFRTFSPNLGPKLFFADGTSTRC